jgi:hypothetical protein
MKKEFQFIVYFLFFIFFIGAIQHYVIRFLFPDLKFYYATIQIYIFQLIATFVVCTFVFYVNKVFFDKTGFAFIAATFIKMMACILFLFPFIQSDINNKVPDVIMFFIPYFIFLLFDTIFAVRLMKEQ